MFAASGMVVTLIPLCYVIAELRDSDSLLQGRPYIHHPHLPFELWPDVA
jgi:hypothetical protein